MIAGESRILELFRILLRFQIYRLGIVADIVKAHGPLLNDCLIAGESRILELFRILLRFQIYRLGIVADIMKAHLNTNVVSEDRDVLSLLWVDNI